jgi:signal transduction histidine kinase
VRDDIGTPHRMPRRALVVGPLVLLVFEIVGTIGASRHEHAHRGIGLLALVLVAIGPVALLGFRRRPVEVLWVVLAATLGYLLLGYAYGPVLIAAGVGLFAAVVCGHRAAAWFGFAALYIGHFVARAWVLHESVTWQLLLGVAAWGLVVLSVAEVARIRRERAIVAGAARRETARRQANEERLRIARELHDVVAHHMSLINVQAGVALHLVDRNPGQVETALSVIKDASKEALAEMRSLVDVLRDEGSTAPRAPAPMLTSLDALVERGAMAGLEVSRRTDGEVRELPAAVELATVRIVQEAVTNVVRHAAASRVEIVLDYRAGRLLVRVDDDGRGVPMSSLDALTGNGIQGMRERAVALGGRFAIEPSTLSGVGVRVDLPTEERG